MNKKKRGDGVLLYYMAVYTGKRERKVCVQTAGNNSNNLRTMDIN